MNPTWRILPEDWQAAHRLADACGLDPIMGQLLLNRGLRTPEQAQSFLSPSLETLSEPGTVRDLPRAVARLRQAIARRETIVIFGDSDADGLTASVILYEALRDLGAAVVVRLSNRLTDGYGLPQRLIHSMSRSSTKLVVLVDCGTNQPEAVQRLADQDIETIIVDHHVPLDRRATPYALINPHVHGDPVHRDLSSAGLAFKVAQALLNGTADERLAAFLDVAALGTLADCGPLRGDNRTLVTLGIGRIVSSARPGLARLCAVTRTTRPQPEHVVQRLVPRLNASGRLGHPEAIWRLLVRDGTRLLDPWMARAEAAHARTKQLYRQMVAQAQEQVNRFHFRDQFVIKFQEFGNHRIDISGEFGYLFYCLFLFFRDSRDEC